MKNSEYRDPYKRTWASENAKCPKRCRAARRTARTIQRRIDRRACENRG